MSDTPLSRPPSLFGTPPCPAFAYCEAFLEGTTPREQWQPLIAALDALDPEVLHQRQERVRRMRHEDGATFNPFDDPSGRGIPWALDMIPLPLTASEWGELEAGVTQRALLLEKILADVYGAQNLLKSGELPAELVYANPKFLHPCHGIQPAGRRYLTFYALDLVRGLDGRFRVVRDHGSHPAGLGYALENRIVISRIFSSLYHQTQILRLAPFFQTLHHNLTQRAAKGREDPRIVLLSPGPDSRIYFEHALLSRYLGYPLVEGQDLTVRNGELFLKKLAGLEPVEAIFRHLSDEASDPFALRRESAAGVAGLIQAAREQQVEIVNPIGSGFVDTPALAVFLPALCRQLMGAELLLENHPSWWYGNSAGRPQVLAAPEEGSLIHAMDGSAAVASGELEAAIQAAPHTVMGRAALEPSTTPAWSAHGIQAQRTLLRLFACATPQGFAVMPGGLAICAPDVQTLMNGHPEKQSSKDVWVLSDRPVAPFTLISSLQTVTEFRRGSDLPSRVADHLLWLGRYLERTESLIRRLRSVYRRLSGETRPTDIPELPFLLSLLSTEETIAKAAENGQIPRFRELAAHLDGALHREDRPDSVAANLRRVREAARNVRDRLSLDSWRVINRLETFSDGPSGDPLELLDNTLFILNAFSGLAMESMTRGLGWRFMDMGRRVERAINHTALIRVALPRLCAESQSAFEALLEVADSIMTYRSRYRTTFQLAPVLDLLLVDEDNPKSLAFQCNQLAIHVEHLPRPEKRRFATPVERLALEMLTSVRLLDLTQLKCDNGDPQSRELADFLLATEKRLRELGQQITAHYLTRITATPHFATLFGDARQ